MLLHKLRERSNKDYKIKNVSKMLGDVKIIYLLLYCVVVVVVVVVVEDVLSS